MNFVHQQFDPVTNITSKDTLKGRFYTTPDGNVYPSITTVLGSKEKPELQNWRLRLGDKKAEREMKRASDRGTAVHSMIENYLNNADEPTKGFDPIHVREFNSLRLRLKGINNIVCQEIPLYSDVLKVAGRVDCIGEYNGVLSIIDFKTSTNDKRADMIDDYFIQTSAYAIMFQEMYGVQINQVVIIMSSEKGAVPLLFKREVDEWIEPLCERINNFYLSRKA